MKKLYLLLALIALPALAFANAGTYDQATFQQFQQFQDTVMSFATGPLGTGLATLMLVMGGAVGVARNSPMPALTGIIGAATLHFMPGIVMNLTQPPGNIPASTTAAQVVAAAPKPTPNLTTLTASNTQAAANPQVATNTRSGTLAPQAAASSKTDKSVLTDAAMKKAIEQNPELATLSPASLTVAANSPVSETTSSASHPVSASHTIPVPAAVHPHVIIKAPAVSSSQVTKWVGLGGAAIILALLGLLMYLSAQRRARATGGFTPGGSTSAPNPGSVFSDPHGFKREKRSPTFGHEST